VSGDAVIVTREAGWAQVQISRATKRNALDRATRMALRHSFEALQGDVRAVVLTGAGTSFCAGLDLTERAADVTAGRPDTAGEEAIALNMAIRNHPAIFIAAVNGTALGGGVTLVNFCDLAVAAETATLGAPEIASATYASMAGPTAQILLTRKRAAWFLLSNERLDAATAKDWGLVNEVVPDNDLLPRCHALARRIAAFDPIALAEVKNSLNRIPTEITDWESALHYGQSVNTRIRAQKTLRLENQI
jgi:enoyl-CoA hydratase/carnithine racemase